MYMWAGEKGATCWIGGCSNCGKRQITAFIKDIIIRVHTGSPKTDEGTLTMMIFLGLAAAPLLVCLCQKPVLHYCDVRTLHTPDRATHLTHRRTVKPEAGC